jgi:predicted phage terminase large subunit-like protein
MEYPDLKRAVRQQWQEHRATVVLIEDKASGTQLIQELIAEGLSSVTGCAPEHDKVMRLYAHTATIENGFLYLPREAPWRADYLHELTTFPNAKFDDQADSTSQALSWIKQAPGEPAITKFYRMETGRMLSQSLPLAAAAAQAQTTPEELQNWIEETERGRVELEEAYYQASRPPCAKCGKPLGIRTVQCGPFEYHPECFTG